MSDPRVKLCLISVVLVFMVRFCCVPAEHGTRLVLPAVICSVRRIRARFGPQVKSNIRVKDSSGVSVPVPQSEGPCGVRKSRDKNHSLSFISRYDSCFAYIKDSTVVIPLQVQLKGEDRWFRVNISCPLIKRYSERRTQHVSTPFPGPCGTERALRLVCGHQSISADACYKLGCCYDNQDLTCYYRLNACSLDGHFVFLVQATDTDPPLRPSSLTVKDHPQCLPVIATRDSAVFKIGLKDCGANMKVAGDVVIYEVEVEELDSKTTAGHSPFSLQVQCEFQATDLLHTADLRTFSSIANPPPVVGLGNIKVQMRIATDASFSSFFSKDQLPVTIPLREAAYVEVSLTQPSPDPALTLRVRDCFAYPASRHSVWTLLYDGCPNPLDNMKSSVPVDHQGQTTSHSRVRRFDVKVFAFMDPRIGQPSTEEMYFYCWVEICTRDMDCAQRCSIISSEGERQRRNAPSDSKVQLISVGPLLLGQNLTDLEDSPYVKQNTVFQVILYVLCGIGAVLLLILPFTVWSICRKRREEAEPACDACPKN
ncbi:zona pellucida sperm-binding protein 4-like [Thalassophryne amazonica]|uniref:zona pellucida sperm-binding protein 4-like n=1 Tax=Thalassophryne amazonica TaxID=390379 RepID=UPI001471D749|nr:zona pellucida sperm-binding protein 4-like [Thalassophryne amazonica]